MQDIISRIRGYKNHIFIGEAGSGKSEIALNIAFLLKQSDEKEVHFFDLDMTKPLFRSRDAAETLNESGVTIHYQEQFMDAPTTVGGVREKMKDPSAYTVLDVGGDYIGARALGGFSRETQQTDTAVYYVLNAFRPWSRNIEHIDQTLSQILGFSHICPDKLYYVNNANCGSITTPELFMEGTRQLNFSLSPYVSISFSTATMEIRNHLSAADANSVLPIRLYLSYPWNTT